MSICPVDSGTHCVLGVIHPLWLVQSFCLLKTLQCVFGSKPNQTKLNPLLGLWGLDLGDIDPTSATASFPQALRLLGYHLMASSFILRLQSPRTFAPAVFLSGIVSPLLFMWHVSLCHTSFRTQSNCHPFRDRKNTSHLATLPVPIPSLPTVVMPTSSLIMLSLQWVGVFSVPGSSGSPHEVRAHLLVCHYR